MRLSTLRLSIGCSLLGLHLLSVVLCAVWLEPLITQSDVQLTIFILAPVSSVFIVAFVKHLAQNIFVNPPDENEPRVRPSYSFVAVGLISFFGFFIIYSLYEYKTGKIIALDDLKFRLLWIESTTGAFLGTLIEPLFGSKPN